MEGGGGRPRLELGCWIIIIRHLITQPKYYFKRGNRGVGVGVGGMGYTVVLG